MALLERSDSVFAGLPDQFVSPFPSESAQLSKKFQALTSNHDGYMAQRQATAWQQVTQLTMRELFTSREAGGLPSAIVNQLVYTEGGAKGGGALLRGVFAAANFSNSSSPKKLLGEAGKVGLSVSLNLMGAAPFVGRALTAAVAVGKFVAEMRRSDKDPDLIVPWEAYSRDTDEDMVNQILIPQVAGSVDWTQVWEPPFNLEGGFDILETDQPGENRSYGVWTGSGNPDYRKGALGMMPGTQQIADRVQVATLFGKIGQARMDAITNVGDFYPGVSQYATGAWDLVNGFDRSANPLAGSANPYKIQPAYLHDLWNEYWQAFFAEGFDLLRHYNDKKGADADVTALFLAKSLARFVVLAAGPTRAEDHIGVPNLFLRGAGSSLTTVINEELFNNPDNALQTGTIYESPYRAIIRPALDTLKRRQRALLGLTAACAYVRPRSVGELPAFAAFKDPGYPMDPNFGSWGEELAAYCVDIRKRFLRHDIVWTVRPEDVREVDPPFADEVVEAQKGERPQMGLAVRTEPLAEGEGDPPPTEPPAGGVPFAVFKMPAKRRTVDVGKVAAAGPGLSTLQRGAIIGGAVIGTAAVAGGGYYLWERTR